MSVSVQGLRNAADYMQLTTGEDQKWLRDAADEIEKLRKEVSALKTAQDKT